MIGQLRIETWNSTKEAFHNEDTISIYVQDKSNTLEHKIKPLNAALKFKLFTILGI